MQAETSQSKYVLQSIDLYFRRLGYDKVILQHDGEPAIRALVETAVCWSFKSVVAEFAPSSTSCAEPMNGSEST